MKLLLDESLPRRLQKELIGHEVVTVPEKGWAGKTNGELLTLASEAFDIFITADQNLEYQQELSKFSIGVIILAAPTNRFPDLRPLVPKILEILKKTEPGKPQRVSI